MSKFFNLNSESERILNQSLSVKSTDDIIERDFSDRIPENEKDRGIVSKFIERQNRGSVRANMGIYTKEDREKAQKEIAQFNLP